MSVGVVLTVAEQRSDQVKYFDRDDGAALRAAFEETVLDWPGVTATTTFGCPSYRADGTLFAVLVTEGVALTRLPDERREAIAREFATGPFEAGDRTVTKWVQVAVDDAADLDSLVPHVRASYESALEAAD
jgi:hypothetical protein